MFGDDQNRTIQAKPSSFSCWFQIASASTRETELPDRVYEEIEVSEEARRLLSEHSIDSVYSRKLFIFQKQGESLKILVRQHFSKIKNIVDLNEIVLKNNL